MGEYARSARGPLVSTGGTMMVNLPFEPQAVELINYTAAATPASGGIPFVSWDFDMGQGYAVNEVFNGTPVLTTSVVTAGGISTFSAGISLQFAAPQQVVSATKANPAVFTVTNHGYQSGDVVVFEGLFQSPTTGMPQMSGMTFVVTKIDANTFSVPWNTNQSSYTALSGSPSGATVKKVLFPFLYAPGTSFITNIQFATPSANYTTITTTSPHNLVVGSELAFRIPQLWGTVQLNSLSDPRRPGSPMYAFVTAVPTNTSVVVKVNSSFFTPFNSNIAVNKTSGLSFPQMAAVGDLNTGGWPYTGGNLFPSPQIGGSAANAGTSTINGPAVMGAFVNNTSSGFVIGASVCGSLNDQFYYKAYLYDYSPD